MLRYKFMEISAMVQANKSFDWFLPDDVRRGHHVTQIPGISFYSPYLRRFHINYGLDWPNGFGEEAL